MSPFCIFSIQTIESGIEDDNRTIANPSPRAGRRLSSRNNVVLF